MPSIRFAPLYVFENITVLEIFRSFSNEQNHAAAIAWTHSVACDLHETVNLGFQVLGFERFDFVVTVPTPHQLNTARFYEPPRDSIFQLKLSRVDHFEQTFFGYIAGEEEFV